MEGVAFHYSIMYKITESPPCFDKRREKTEREKRPPAWACRKYIAKGLRPTGAFVSWEDIHAFRYQCLIEEVGLEAAMKIKGSKKPAEKILIPHHGIGIVRTKQGLPRDCWGEHPQFGEFQITIAPAQERHIHVFSQLPNLRYNEDLRIFNWKWRGDTEVFFRGAFNFLAIIYPRIIGWGDDIPLFLDFLPKTDHNNGILLRLVDRLNEFRHVPDWEFTKQLTPLLHKWKRVYFLTEEGASRYSNNPKDTWRHCCTLYDFEWLLHPWLGGDPPDVKYKKQEKL